MRVEVDNASSELRHYKIYLTWQHAKTVGIATAVLAVVALVMIKLLMPAPLTEAGAYDIEVEQAMNSLSFSQQERIQKI